MCRRIICGIFAVIICAVSFCGCKEEKNKYPEPTKEFFVNDFAGIMSESDRQTVISMGAALDNATKAQAVVVTVGDLDGEEISEYALNLGRKWGVGDKEKNSGVLILLSVEERQIYVAVGYGLEGALPDSKTGRLIDTYAIELLKNGNYGLGLTSLYTAVVNEIYIEYNLPVPENYTPIDNIPQENGEEPSAKTVLISWIIMMVIVAVLLFIGRKRGILFLVRPGGFGGFGGFGGGNFRGGGGFGGFGGGGGSFGGGGAGRGF